MAKRIFMSLKKKPIQASIEVPTTAAEVTPVTAKVVRRPRRARRQDLTTTDWKRVRSEIIERDGTICHYCKRDCSDDPTVDHVDSVFCGGAENHPAHLLVACPGWKRPKGGRPKWGGDPPPKKKKRIKAFVE